MFEIIENLPKEVLGIKATGSISRTDYTRSLLPIFDNAKKNHTKLRLLFVIDTNLSEFSAGAFWEDIKASFKFINIFEKCAIVTDIKWMRDFTSFFKNVLPFHVKAFASEDFDKALDWLEKQEKSKIHYRFDRDKGNFELKVDEELSERDFEKIAKAIDPWIEANGPLNSIIIKTEEFPGWEGVPGLVSHLKFVRNHHQNVKKVAFVADSFAAKMVAPIASHFLNADVKHFDADKLTEARQFISH